MVINISINTAPSPVTQPLKVPPLEVPQEISLGASSKMVDVEDVDGNGKKSSFDEVLENVPEKVGTVL